MQAMPMDDRSLLWDRSSIYSYLTERFGVDLSVKSPIELPNIGRDGFAEMLGLWGCRVGVEVGVERALYSETLCRAIPGLHLYGVDCWAPYLFYRDHVDSKKLERFYHEAMQRVVPYNVTLIRKFSVEAAKDFEDDSLDFVYIDGNHRFEYVVEDLAAWSRKVRHGGIISGHDFISSYWPSMMHVPEVLHGWTRAYEIRQWFVVGRRAKIPGEIRDDGRSWFFLNTPKPAWRKGQRQKPIRQ